MSAARQESHPSTPGDRHRCAPTGYAHPAYARALAEFGIPVALPGSGGWLLQRPIENTTHLDAAGPYPMFSCSNWKALADDLNALRGELVSAVIVADPFGAYDQTFLRSCFDHVIPFKTHFVVDLDEPGPYARGQHARHEKRALREVAIEVCHPPETLLEDWVVLYNHLIQRHAIRGIQAFSRESFRRQFAVPGLVALRATDRSGECVGAQLWFVQGDVAYYHLGAANERGYRSSCSYALYSGAIRFFRGRVRWLNLGGGAGCNQRTDGLTKFKEGWSNATKTAFLCGRILNSQQYEKLSARAGAQGVAYFPAYRY